MGEQVVIAVGDMCGPPKKNPGQAATADLLENARAQGHEFEILAKPVHPQDLLAKLKA